MRRSEAQVIEHFHLAFLGVLNATFDPARYVLKGGANLRFFFHSVRYSEDIDLDLIGMQPWRLADKIDAAIGSPALRLILRPGGLTVAEFTKPKQTDTTRRWKVSIGAAGRSSFVRTKIEFSNREPDVDRTIEAVPGRVVRPYALRPPKIQHYELEAAVKQKVVALARRSQTQTRDVFDLELLLRTGHLQPGSIEPSTLEEAASRALALPFDAFKDQVSPFLDPVLADSYDAEAWEQMQTFVAESLEAGR